MYESWERSFVSYYFIIDVLPYMLSCTSTDKCSNAECSQVGTGFELGCYLPTCVRMFDAKQLVICETVLVAQNLSQYSNRRLITIQII